MQNNGSLPEVIFGWGQLGEMQEKQKNSRN